MSSIERNQYWSMELVLLAESCRPHVRNSYPVLAFSYPFLSIEEAYVLATQLNRVVYDYSVPLNTVSQEYFHISFDLRTNFLCSYDIDWNRLNSQLINNNNCTSRRWRITRNDLKKLVDGLERFDSIEPKKYIPYRRPAFWCRGNMEIDFQSVKLSSQYSTTLRTTDFVKGPQFNATRTNIQSTVANYANY